MTKYEVGKHFTKGKHWIGLAFVVNTEKAEDENYFLLFGRRSLHFAAHPDAVDDEAVRFAELLIRQL